MNPSKSQGNAPTDMVRSRILDRAVAVLHRHPLLTMAILLVAGMSVVQWHLSRLSQRLVDAAALQGTGLYSDALAEFRTLYTSEVVSRVADHGIHVTHDYRERDGAIPLPATLSMELGKAIGNRGSGLQVRLYSAYPFPWRQATGGPRDDFEREALDRLSRDPGAPFYRFEEKDGKVALRYATADRMRSACVGCHNNHPDSPKRDWKEGDVRGVLAVTRPLDALRADTRRGLRETFLTMAAMTLAGLGLLGAVIGRLRRTTGDLEARVREVQERETRIRLINEQLLVAHDEALSANHAKSEFLATMSHELRTPLNHIIGYSELLEDEVKERSQDDLSADIQKIHAAGSDLLAIVNDVLDLARIDAGRMDVVPEDFDVRRVVDEVLTATRPLADRNGDTLRIDVAPDVGTMHADVTKLRQSLLNLLSNACKFTQNGEVTLAVRTSVSGGGRTIEFQVRDTGIGIPREHLGSLFRSFSMVDASTTRKHGGMGLGLVLTKRFCQMMGGDIVVASEVSRGSTFTLSIPERAGATPPVSIRKPGDVPQIQPTNPDVAAPHKPDGANP